MKPPRRNPPAATRRSLWKSLRILVLLLVLLFAALQNWENRYQSTRWKRPLYVAIYPIAADASPVSQRYVAALDAASFEPIDRFFAREASRHGVTESDPIKTRLRAPLTEDPPQRASDAGVLATVLWSLRLRFWAWRIGAAAHDPADIEIFVLYHDPALSPTVPHSLGLEKGLIGVVNAFASTRMDGANTVVIAHELLHTLGATDKYDAADDAPRFPDGYGDPQQIPLYPQRKAELMAGRRVLAPGRWVQLPSLDEVVIGRASALEIRWPR